MDESCTLTPRSRLGVSVLVGCLSILLAVFHQLRDPQRHLDVGLVWFAARALLARADPYPLVGSGLAFDQPWPLLSPATSGVAVLPLALLPELPATLLFVGASAALLTYGLT